MLAALVGVWLEEVTVQVSGTVDVRGALDIDSNVPVGFQEMRVDSNHCRALERVRGEVITTDDAGYVGGTADATEPPARRRRTCPGRAGASRRYQTVTGRG